MSLYDFVRSLRITMFSSFVGLTGGIASLAEELARRLPVRFEAPVRRVVVEKGRVVGAELEGSGSVRKANHVVVAVTPPAAASLLTDELAEQRRFFQSIPVTPQVMPVFFLNRRLPADVWSYFTDPGLQRPFLFAVDEHNKIPEMSPRGNAILTLWPGEQMPPEWVCKPDEDILREARKDLEVMLPGVSSSVEEGLVVRHPYVMAACSVGSIGRIIDFRRRAERLKGISFVGDVFGIGMEGAMASAAEAVRRICGNGAAVGPLA
jgi:protoporphyrinogen oxidase